MTYIVDLEAFHGPLDLLLYLVEKNEIDIYDIPVAQLSDQYVYYLQRCTDIDVERMTSFLVMASYLLNLKSQMLLPHYASEEAKEMEADPRDELVRSLLEYKFFKKAAQALQAKQEGDLPGRVFFRDALYKMEVEEEIIADLGALIRAYRNLIDIQQIPRENYSMPQSDFSVTVKMQEILEELQEKPMGMEFQDLAANAVCLRETLAMFLGLLELIRLQKVIAVQKDIFAPILIMLSGGD